MNLTAGHLLQGRYRLDQPMREGLYGQVWRAFDQRLCDRPVAIKCMLPSQPRAALTFEREAELLSALIHPNIIYIHDYFIEDNSPFLVREWIEGRPLSVVALEKPPPLEQVALWAEQMGSALAYMHTRPRPVLLLDLTPQNILLDDFGMLHFTEFGLSRFRDEDTEGVLKGLHTPRFASPEQIRGDEPAEAADQYMMAAVLWFLLTGQAPPHPLQAPGDLRPEIPPGLDRAILKMMAPHPSGRFRSVTDASCMLGIVFTERLGVEFEWVKSGKPADLRVPDLPMPHVPCSYQERPARVLWINTAPYDTDDEPANMPHQLLQSLAALPSMQSVVWPVDVVRRVAAPGCGTATPLPPPAYSPIVRTAEPTASFETLAGAGLDMLQLVERLQPLQDAGVQVEARNVFIDAQHGRVVILPDVKPPELVETDPDTVLVKSLLFSLFFGFDRGTFESYVEGDPRRWRRSPEALRHFLSGVTGSEAGPTSHLRLLQRIIDTSYLCPHCSEEVFFDEAVDTCASCAGSLHPPRLMHIGGNAIVLKPGSRIYPHHLHHEVPCDFVRPLAVVGHFNRRLMAENMSDTVWTVRQRDGGVTSVTPGHRIALEEGRCIEFNVDMRAGLPADVASASGEVI